MELTASRHWFVAVGTDTHSCKKRYRCKSVLQIPPQRHVSRFFKSRSKNGLAVRKSHVVSCHMVESVGGGLKTTLRRKRKCFWKILGQGLYGVNVGIKHRE
jgi:hypothetical protein